MSCALMLALELAPPARATAPPAGAPWTLGETLAEIRSRGARLVLSSRGVRLRHANRLPALAEAVQAHAPALALWVRLGGASDGSRPAWGDATRLHALWFAHAFEPPARGVEIGPGRRITDWPVYRASVASRLAAGPAVVGAQNVADELGALFSAWGPVPVEAHAPERVRAQAA